LFGRLDIERFKFAIRTVFARQALSTTQAEGAFSTVRKPDLFQTGAESFEIEHPAMAVKRLYDSSHERCTIASDKPSKFWLFSTSLPDGWRESFEKLIVTFNVASRIDFQIRTGQAKLPLRFHDPKGFAKEIFHLRDVEMLNHVFTENEIERIVGEGKTIACIQIRVCIFIVAINIQPAREDDGTTSDMK
jgi:hypothetical protein